MAKNAFDSLKDILAGAEKNSKKVYLVRKQVSKISTLFQQLEELLAEDEPVKKPVRKSKKVTANTTTAE